MNDELHYTGGIGSGATHYRAVEELDDRELRALCLNAPADWLAKTPRQKDALRELRRRLEMRPS